MIREPWIERLLMNRVKQFLIDLRSGLWFLPALIVSGFVALAAWMIYLDAQIGHAWMEDWPRLFGVGPEGSRGMLSAIASSMITVAGVIFSITIAALAQASSQYTPRILRNFMRDRANQAVLGVFAGIFAYCLVVLRTIRGGDEGSFVPGLAVMAAFALALLGIGVLIFFIHHIASSLEATTIISAAAAETSKAIDTLFPDDLGEESPEESPAEEDQALAGRGWREIPSLTTGYIQNIDVDALLRFARERETVLRMNRGIGEFVVERTPLASLALDAGPDAETIKEVNDLYVIGSYRTIEQDAAFGVRQIVDIALKALSPGVNDTTTAATCVDYLTAILTRLASRRIPAPRRYDGEALRVIAVGPAFEEMLGLSFHQIRQNAEGNVAIIIRLLGALETIAARARAPHRRRALLEQAELIKEMAERVGVAADRRRIEDQAARVIRLFEDVDPQRRLIETAAGEAWGSGRR